MGKIEDEVRRLERRLETGASREKYREFSSGVGAVLKPQGKFPSSWAGFWSRRPQKPCLKPSWKLLGWRPGDETIEFLWFVKRGVYVWFIWNVRFGTGREASFPGFRRRF
ncbi:MAG: hypothetical protein KIH08_15620 [Candidatus Freyarchaeota archaeon]|nr:hypothetical protein [Candidatus Jordarchaeia archaeon]